MGKQKNRDQYGSPNSEYYNYDKYDDGFDQKFSTADAVSNVNPFLQPPHPAYWANQKNAYPEMTPENELQMFDENSLKWGKNANLQKNPLINLGTDNSLRKSLGYPTESMLPEDINQSGNVNDWYNRADSVPKTDLFSKTNNYTPLDSNALPSPPDRTMDYSSNLYNPLDPNFLPLPPDRTPETDFYNPLDLNALPPPPDRVLDYSSDLYIPLDPNALPAPDPQTREPELDFSKPFNPAIIKMDNKGALNQPIKMPGTGPLPPNNSKFNIENPYMKDKPGVAEAYYMAKAGLDATALIGNMIQPEPPSLQMKMPHYERSRFDSTLYEEGRSDIKEQANQAYRYTREGISQASDLMKGLSAITSGTQQNLQQLTTQEAAAQDNTMKQNQGIAIQENKDQVSILNQEAAMNYQIQQNAQQWKDQQVSGQLGRIGDTAGAYANYVNMKEHADKVSSLYKSQAGLTNEVQLQMLKLEMANKELSGEGYKDAEQTAVNQYINETKGNLYEDPKYAKLKGKFGENYDPMKYDEREKEISVIEQRINDFGKQYDGFKDITKLDTETPEAFAKRQEELVNAKKSYETNLERLKSEKEISALDKQFYGELKSAWDFTGKRKDFKSTYLKDRGLPNNEEIVAGIESLIERARQL